MRYRVEMVCYVEVPPEGVPDGSGGPLVKGPPGAFTAAYSQISDDNPDEVWICEVDEEATLEMGS